MTFIIGKEPVSMSIQMREYPNPNNSYLPLRVAKGHFATSHSHINYFIDLF